MRLFALKRKLEESNDKGVCDCVTCDSRMHYTEIQNGHYIDRKHNSTTFLPENNHPQCETCNVYKRGNINEYTKYLDDRYGEGTSERLKRLKHRVFRLSEKFLEDLIEQTKKEIDVLEKEKQNKDTV